MHFTAVTCYRFGSHFTVIRVITAIFQKLPVNLRGKTVTEVTADLFRVTGFFADCGNYPVIVYWVYFMIFLMVFDPNWNYREGPWAYVTNLYRSYSQINLVILSLFSYQLIPLVYYMVFCIYISIFKG